MSKKIFHRIKSAGVEFTEKEWHDYLSKQQRIETTIGDYTFNDCDVCINAKTETSLKIDKFYYVVFQLCDCGNGWYTFGLDCSVGDCGHSFYPSYADDSCTKEKYNLNRAFKSLKELKKQWCDETLCWLKGTTEYKEGKAKAIRLVEFVEEYKQTIGKPKVTQLTLF